MANLNTRALRDIEEAIERADMKEKAAITWQLVKILLFGFVSYKVIKKAGSKENEV